MLRGNEGNALPDQRRHDGDDALINRALVKKGADDLTSAHHPDVLAIFLTKALGKGLDRFRDKLHAYGRGCRGRTTREDIVHVFCAEACAHLHTYVEGLATENLGIDGTRKLRETVEALWSWPPRQPIQIAIAPSDIPVRARGDMDYDLSLWHRSIFAQATRAAKRNCRKHAITLIDPR